MSSRVIDICVRMVYTFMGVSSRISLPRCNMFKNTKEKPAGRKNKPLTSFQVIILSFFCLILVGTFLLMLFYPNEVQIRRFHLFLMY